MKFLSAIALVFTLLLSTLYLGYGFVNAQGSGPSEDPTGNTQLAQAEFDRAIQQQILQYVCSGLESLENRQDVCDGNQSETGGSATGFTRAEVDKMFGCPPNPSAACQFAHPSNSVTGAEMKGKCDAAGIAQAPQSFTYQGQQYTLNGLDPKACADHIFSLAGVSGYTYDDNDISDTTDYLDNYAQVSGANAASNDPGDAPGVDFEPVGSGNDLVGIGDNPLVRRLIEIFNILSVGVGVAVAASITYSGVQYASSAGNPQVTQAAIKRIIDAVIGLALWIFMWALINWLIPGGILNL